MRNVINIIIGILLVAGAIFIAIKMDSSKKKQKVKAEKSIKRVTTETVKNDTTYFTISASGVLKAHQKIEIYAEVQGIFKNSNKLFKTGETYKKGEVVLSINGSEYYASLLSQKNNFYNLVAALIPDLKLDFPSSFNAWELYLKELDINKPIPKFPEPNSAKENYFISGKQIISSYYTIKNMEKHYNKYKIQAPFDGILTESLVTEGTLIRSGQKLGEFINPKEYELEINVNKKHSNLLEIGKVVKLTDLDKTKTWNGKIVRVNGRIDQSTQTIATFIKVVGNDLKEGIYLDANFESGPVINSIEIARKLLVNNNSVFVVNNNQLESRTVKTQFFMDKTVIVSGLKDGELLLEKPIVGAYDGMLVRTE